MHLLDQQIILKECQTEHTHLKLKKPARIAIKLVIQPTILSGMAISVKS